MNKVLNFSLNFIDHSLLWCIDEPDDTTNHKDQPGTTKISEVCL